MPTKDRFERSFGWKYGLALGIGLALAGWGQDAWQLFDASAELAWAKLLLALVTIVPLTAAAGWLASRTSQRFLLLWLIWIAWASLTGLVAGHLAFEPLTALASLADPLLRGLTVFPFTSESAFMTGVAVFLGILASFPAALLQVLSTDWAWDRSSADGRMSFGAWATLTAGLLVGLVLGALDDSMVNATLRLPIQLTHQVVQVSLTTPPNLDITQMPQRQQLAYMAGMPWRGKLSGRFTQYLADYDPSTYQSETVDLAFDNGLILRCQTAQYGAYVTGCFDLAAEYRGLAAQFLETGKIVCDNCTAAAAPAAVAWRSQQSGTQSAPTQIQVSHHSGGIVEVSASYGSGGAAACLLDGANPVVIESCGSIGAMN